MTENTAPIEDRAANIKENVRYIIDRGLDAIYENFDRLHRRGIHDNDVVEALRDLGEEDILDGYAEWADIDLREDNNTTLDPIVPDPASAPSYKEHVLNQIASDITTIEQLALLEDGVVLALRNGNAGQIRKDEVSHHLRIAGSDIWINIMTPDDDGNWEIVGAADRRDLAYYLPATVLGDSK